MTVGPHLVTAVVAACVTTLLGAAITGLAAAAIVVAALAIEQRRARTTVRRIGNPHRF